MADRPPDTGDATGVGPDRGSTTGTPRWVKVFGIIALVLVLLFVALLLTGRGGGHGPGRHAPSGDAGGHTPPPASQKATHRPVALIATHRPPA
jgi:hypothetical protein